MAVWTMSDYLKRTKGWRPRFLGRGAFGVVNLVTNGQEKLVVKLIDRLEERSFLREARALSKVRGLDGLQQVEAVVLDHEYFIIISQFAGASLGVTVEKQQLSPAHLEDALEQLRAALKRMHKVGVTHLDLHRDNVCLLLEEERVQATVIDLGQSRFEGELHFEENVKADRRAYGRLVAEMRAVLEEAPAAEDKAQGEDQKKGKRGGKERRKKGKAKETEKKLSR